VFVTPDAESENFRNFRGIDAAMTTEEMKEMVEAGISVQSHGMSHRILTELSPEELRWELGESKAVLEDAAGRPVQCLSIPWGPFNRAVKDASKEVGYEAVFGNKKGSNHRGSDLYDLRRVVVERDFSLADFAKSLRPLGACQLRVQGWVKRLAFLLLGNRRLIRFRGSPFFRAFIAPWFAFGRLKGVLLAGYILSVLLFGAALYMWFIA
jgi:peptidoglycan/xylan/chitin deacetylase (PgdA/CDA1 family)